MSEILIVVPPLQKVKVLVAKLDVKLDPANYAPKDFHLYAGDIAEILEVHFDTDIMWIRIGYHQWIAARQLETWAVEILS